MEEYIKETVVPEILTYYKREDCKIGKCEVRRIGNLVDNWSSILYELDLNILVKNNDELVEENYSLFIKSILDDYKNQKIMQNRKQFSNEVHIYKIVQPIFQRLLNVRNFKLFIDSPYAVINNCKSEGYLDQRDGVVVLENLKTQGYKLGPRIILDKEHCDLALEQLGRFHAMSLALKALNPQQFHSQIISPLEECIFDSESEISACEMLITPTKRLCENAAYPQNSKTYQAIKTLRSKCDDMPAYVKKLLTSSQRSKFNVLCHGDYCRNNIMFKYNDSDKPTHASPIDYQYARHGSPGLDLSFFVYMNADHELRKNCFKTMIKKYHESLTSTMREIFNKERETRSGSQVSSALPTFDDILEDFRKYGAFGMIHAIYFVPWMMCDKNELQNVTEASIDSTSKEYRDAAMTLGGDAATKAVLEMFDDAITSDQILIE